MGDLKPLAVDIETSGLDPDSVITVLGYASHISSIIYLNTGRREVDEEQLLTDVRERAGQREEEEVSLCVVNSEKELLHQADNFLTEQFKRRHYLTAYNGEKWKDGFDLPFIRSSCIKHRIDWPFDGLPYCDTMTMMERIRTEADDLETVYDELIGYEHCDPFDSSESAVKAWDNEEWADLILHNLADIQRTLDLADMAEEYVAKKDFRMKNLSPP